MKQIVFISDDKLGDIILAEGEVSTLEKSIYDQINAQKAGVISA
jgi:ADP-heptose:LPS heptosyltransferase